MLNTQQSIATRAALKGFTVPVFIEASVYDIEAFAKPDTDYDDRFRAICAETGDTLVFEGWNVITREVA
ncbi:MAG TPA: hypothetical protein VFE18_16290 [Phenylobacterium sp.]|jgi:hypothetical protein|uniref:hypothetical protein n=1 Tax=Phenylobacterium sp. TaxID=1871053 RepID=UPI002D6DF658|nr:hypothetical protein [Phenylobacterium sp.]HZZ69733.1 hypothetical protein [Phenylobacterium sp.]